MKRIFMFAFILTMVGCGGEKQTAEINLATMQCGMCKDKIETAVTALKGVTKVDINLGTKTGKVTYKASLIDLASIEGAISAVGYDANDTKADRSAYEGLAACCKVPGSQ